TILEGLSETSPSDMKLRKSVALAHKKIGASHALLGDTRASQASFGRALAIEEPLVAAEPENAALKRDLTFTLSDMGLNDYKLGDLRSSIARYRRALEIRETLLAADPRNGDFRWMTASAHDNLGAILTEAG